MHNRRTTNHGDPWTHRKEDPIYVFPELKMRGFFPNFPIHASVRE
jgi:hypothetical protein